MTTWFALEGVDFAVTGELVKGITPALDRFEVKSVRVRGAGQDVKGMLRDSFERRLTARALQEAQHPMPFAYDVPTGGGR